MGLLDNSLVWLSFSLPSHVHLVRDFQGYPGTWPDRDNLETLTLREKVHITIFNRKSIDGVGQL
jgi:hypothetical protein